MKKTYRDPETGKKMAKIVHDSGVTTYKVWATGETWSEPPEKPNGVFQNFPKEKPMKQDFSFLDQLPPAPPNHAYLVTKKIGPATAKIQENYLVIPFQNVKGEIVGGQKIFGDGKKINFTGSLKTGTFHTIPATTNLDKTYLVEGFATGVSVHEATGAKVIVAFGTGNYKSIVSHFPNLIIAADNDKAGIEAAKLTKQPYTFPPIEGMDWNDYAQSHPEAIQTEISKLTYPVLTNTDNETYPFLFLGHDEKTKEFFFFHKESKSVYALDGENITQGKLIYLCDLSFWEQYKTKNGSIDMKETSNFLARESFKTGKYIKNIIRGTGVWLENNSLVVNGFDGIWKDQKQTEYGKIGKHIYISENNPFLSLTNPCSEEKAVKLFQLIQKLSWKNKTSADFLYSWIAQAPLAGASAWRSHIWVSGGRGSGKSEVKREIIMPMLNIEMADNLGSTEAGIRQGRQMSATPLVYDEAEVTDQKTRQIISSVVKTICLASDSDSKVSKGSSGHKEYTFNINFCACLFSIGVSLEEPQYRSRFSILELEEDKNNGYSEKGGTRDQLRELISGDFRNEFFSLTISQYPNLVRNYETFYNYLKDKYSSRFAQQVGTLLSGSFTMQYFKVGSEKEVKDFIESKDLTEESIDNSSKNEVDCLGYLFSKKVQDHVDSFTIGYLIEKVQDESVDISTRERYEKVLQNYGIKYLKKEDVIAISNTSSELKAIFRGTPWESGWGRSIARLPFMFQKSFQVKMNGQNQRCTCIDLIKMNNFLDLEGVKND